MKPLWQYCLACNIVRRWWMSNEITRHLFVICCFHCTPEGCGFYNGMDVPRNGGRVSKPKSTIRIASYMMRCITYVCIWMSSRYISWADVAGSLYLSSYDTENGDSDVGKEKKTWTHIGEENVVIELDMGNIWWWWWWWWCIGKRKRQRWEEGVEEPALELWDNRRRIGME